MAPLPVVRRNTIPIVYDRFAVVSDMIRPDVVWFYLVNAASNCVPMPVRAERAEIAPQPVGWWKWICQAVLPIAGWAAVMLWQALLSVPDYYEMSPAERALWREFDSAVLVRTCDDGTQIYRMRDGDFVKESPDTTETIEDPATACSLNQP